MIDPDVLIEDLEPRGFGRLVGSFGARRTEPWRWVLRRGPRVLHEVGEGERTVTIDLDHVDQLSREIADCADPNLTYQEWNWRCHELFWASPAVTSNLPPPPNPWPAATEQWRRRGWQALRVRVGGEPPLTLVARFDSHGRLSRLTSADDTSETMPTLAATWSEVEGVLAAADAAAALGALLEDRVPEWLESKTLPSD